MKNLTKNMKGIGLSILALSLLIVACNKSATSPAGKKSLSVYLTDDPAPFTAVFIDIKTVEVKIDEDLNHDSHFTDNDNDADDDKTDHDQYGKWDTLNIRPGVYNIMNFRNGVDTLLAAAKIPIGRIGKIRLTLGTNNSVVVANVSHPLQLTPGQNNYVYVKIEDNDLDETPSGEVKLWLDFDLSASIQENQGVFFLKPCIKAFGMEQFGSIEGEVLPKEASSVVKVYSGKDTSTAIPDNGDGDFKIKGLKAGTYSALFKAYNGYKDTTINNIVVQQGKETQLPTVTLRK